MLILPFTVFLCWGSFLNVCAYRLITGGSLWSRSACPNCHNLLHWYDLFPILSWLTLRGKCRSCKAPISPLYPLIELLTASVCTVFLCTINPVYFPAYFLLTTALIITIRTDSEFMLIPRICSLYLVPVGIALAAFQYMPISWPESICGALMGYITLAAIAYLYKKKTGVTGMGDGDPELLAAIGSFVGVTGVWYTLLIASLSASLYAFILIALHKAGSDTKIPFGPFLAVGALATIVLIT